MKLLPVGVVVTISLLLSINVNAQIFKSLNVPTTHYLDSFKLKAPIAIPQPAELRYSYYDNLGAACKAEFKLEKATKIPFRFRLGSLAQTDYMERKPNTQKPE